MAGLRSPIVLGTDVRPSNEKGHGFVFKYLQPLRVFHVGSTVAAGPAEDGLFCERAKRVPT